MDAFVERLMEVIAASNPQFDGEIRLPSERDIAQALKVNRATLREKMAVLEAMGFISRTQGSGTYLSMPRANILKLSFDMALRFKYINIEQLEEVREIIEVGVVRNAAQNASDEDIRALEYFLHRLIEAQEAEYGHELDYTFHMHLGIATHNPVLVMILESLSSALRKLLSHRRRLVSMVPRGLEKTNETHIDIFEAVRDRDPERAVAAMFRHFTIWKDYAGKSPGLKKATGYGVEAKV